jgi:cytochrome P450
LATTTAPAKTPNVSELGVDFAAQSFWAKPFAEREQAFATLRERAPVVYSRPYESTMMPPDEATPGFWSVTKWADCREVSRDTSRFISGEGAIMENYPEVVRVGVASFLMMDGEEHRQLRGIVSNAFTPRNVRKIEGWIHQHAVELVDEMIDRGEGDFCELYAKRLPAWIFGHFMGLERDSEQMHTLVDAAEKMLAWDDPEAQQGRDALTTHADEAMRIQDIALEMAELRRSDPREDDLVSWCVQAEFEGRRMEDWEIASFFSLLASAANDTTRHSMAHGVRLLSENPEQRELLLSDLPGHLDTATEEILRHATPVMHFRRTAKVDTEIRGVPIQAGEAVVMWYCSGNYDEEVFPEPQRFDITRDPNRHLAFGAGGPHFCIGSALGRQMIRSSLSEIYSRMPDIELAGEPQFQVNNFIHGVQRLPVRWTPPRR